MLISPPFLVARGAAQTDDQWIDTCMTGGAVGDGGFPVSAYFGWHGGLHLNAPMNGNVAEPVRAIADGTVVFVRQPTPRPSDPAATHAQMYRGQWTDNGVVIIRHDTEIGEGANGKVSYFSIYMHLSAIETTVVRTRAIYRKSVIGNAGRIYGTQNQIHFEIVCDDANLQRIAGRITGDLPLTANGRTDAIYGQMYFHVPVGAQVYAQQPLGNNATAMMQPPTPRGGAKQAAVVLQPTHTTTEALIVGLRYAGGEGAAADRGDAYLSTYQINGTSLGEAINENEAEYKLYTTAKDISESYPAAARPAPSAVYELLRFGRVIGPDALTPATVPHWRQVRYPGGQGWVNLNAANIHKFSDADMPQWMGWKLIDDDTNPDCRCDSQLLRGLLRNTPAEQLTEAELRTRAALPANAAKLKKTICKFPTEWDAATIDAKWGWLKITDVDKINDADFEVLRAHITVMAFWAAASPSLVGPAGANNAPGAALPATHWHIDPREFVRHFRKCGWMDITEIARTLPNRPGYSATGTVRTSLGVGLITLQTAKQRVTNYIEPLNKTMRKYGISLSRLRQAHFLAQVMLETDKWQVVREYGSGAPHPKIPMIQYYAAFYGRGIMQLTWAGNYETYGKYRNLPNHTDAYVDNRITTTSNHYWGDPTLRDAKNKIIGLDPNRPPRQWSPRYDPNIIALNTFNACDSGGHYWTSKSHDGHNDINRVVDRDFTPSAIGRTSVLVNGGGNGYYERQAYAQYAKRMLTDSTETTITVRFDAARKEKINNEKVDIEIDVNFTIPV
jgi:Peptidase family M23